MKSEGNCGNIITKKAVQRKIEIQQWFSAEKAKLDITPEELKAAKLSYKLILAERDATQSSKQSATQESITTCVMDLLRSSSNKIRELIGQVNEFKECVDEKDKLIAQHQLATPFLSIGRVSTNNGKGGIKWPLHI